MEKFKVVPDESVFFDFSPDEVTLFFYVLGLSVAQPLTISEITVLANGLFETAQVLFLIAAQRTLFNDAITAQQEPKDIKMGKEAKKTAEKLEAKVITLQQQIEYLQRQIDEFRHLKENK